MPSHPPRLRIKPALARSRSLAPVLCDESVGVPYYLARFDDDCLFSIVSQAEYWQIGR